MRYKVSSQSAATAKVNPSAMGIHIVEEEIPSILNIRKRCYGLQFRRVRLLKGSISRDTKTVLRSTKRRYMLKGLGSYGGGYRSLNLNELGSLIN